MAPKKDETVGVLAQVVTILAKIEQVWEQRLLAEKATKDVPATLTVTKQFKLGADSKWTDPKEIDEQISVGRFLTAPAMVGCELGSTINMGNYESARVMVTVSVPCYREEVSAAYDWAKDFVEERFKKEVAEARTYAASVKKGDSPF